MRMLHHRLTLCTIVILYLCVYVLALPTPKKKPPSRPLKPQSHPLPQRKPKNRPKPVINSQPNSAATLRRTQTYKAPMPSVSTQSIGNSPDDKTTRIREDGDAAAPSSVLKPLGIVLIASAVICVTIAAVVALFLVIRKRRQRPLPVKRRRQRRSRFSIRPNSSSSLTPSEITSDISSSDSMRMKNDDKLADGNSDRVQQPANIRRPVSFFASEDVYD